MRQVRASRVDVRAALRNAAAGVALFALSWALLHVAGFTTFELVDTPLYERYGRAILDGEVPYRDLALEYPPGSLPAFVIPAVAGEGGYRTAFEIVHGLLGAVLIVAVALALARIGATRLNVRLATLFLGLSPLLLGPVVLTRFDLWPAALLAVTLLALAYERPVLALGVLGAAASVKLYPLVVAPLALIHVGRRYGTGAALRAGGALVLVAGAIFAPFLALSPEGVVDAIRRQTDRPLQIESLGASVFQVGDLAGLYSRTVETSFGSQNLAGAAPDAAATITTVLQLLALLAIWALFARSGPARGADVAVLYGAAAAAVAAFVALGKVVSPQFMIWLAAIAPLAVGRGTTRWIAPLILGLGGLALVLTHVWFPRGYWDLVALEGGEVIVSLVRNLVIAGLAVALVWVWLQPSPSGDVPERLAR